MSVNLNTHIILPVLYLLQSTFCLLGAATYYVATSGNDLNPGTLNEPWRTIQHASETMLPGDTANIQSGDYGERVSSIRDGQPGSPIIFQTSGNVRTGGFTLKHSYITIDGFEFDASGVPLYQGVVALNTGANNAVISNNSITSPGENLYGIWVNHSASPYPEDVTISNNSFIEIAYHALSLRGSNYTVNDNFFQTSLGGDAIRMHASNSVIRNNTFDDWSNKVGNGNHTDIIQAFSDNGETARNVIFENNIVKDCEECQIGNITDDDFDGKISNWTFRNNLYINVEQAISIYAEGFHWYNNTFYRCTQNTGHPILLRNSNDRGAANNAILHNNVFLECGSDPSNVYRGWYSVDSGLENITTNYNAVSGTNQAKKSDFNESNGINGGNFLDLATNGVFSPTVDSPLIDAGIKISNISTDIEGFPRVNGFNSDIGAYEYQGENSNIGAYEYQGEKAPNSPSNLSIDPIDL